MPLQNETEAPPIDEEYKGNYMIAEEEECEEDQAIAEDEEYERNEAVVEEDEEYEYYMRQAPKKMNTKKMKSNHL